MPRSINFFKRPLLSLLPQLCSCHLPNPPCPELASTSPDKALGPLLKTVTRFSASSDAAFSLCLSLSPFHETPDINFSRFISFSPILRSLPLCQINIVRPVETGNSDRGSRSRPPILPSETLTSTERRSSRIFLRDLTA